MNREEVVKKLSEHCFTETGKAKNARLKIEYLTKNGFSNEVQYVLNECSGVLPDTITFGMKVAVFIKNKVLVPHCKTCGKVYFSWSKIHNDWSSFCSQTCTQNDPEVKAKMLNGRKDVNWDDAIDKRKSSMQEKYGVDTYQKLKQL